MARDVIMPALGMAQESGVLVRWLVPEGGTVVEGDPLMEVETDKAVVEVPATASGTLAAVAYGEGADVAVGTVLAVLLGPGEVAAVAPTKTVDRPPAVDTAPVVATTEPTPATATSEPTPGAAVVSRPVVSSSPSTSRRGTVLASPKAKRLARERGVDLAQVVGTGPHGAVRAVDLPAPAAEPRRPGDIVRPVLASSSADVGAAAWLRRSVDASGLLAFVDRVRASSRAAGAEVTVADVLARVVVTTLQRSRLGPTWSGGIDLSVHGADGDEVRSSLAADGLGSMLAVAASRSAAPAAGADGALPRPTVAVSDRSGELFERSPVALPVGVDLRVTLGAITESVTVREGIPSVGRRATVHVDYREAALTDTEAATLLTRVCGLLEEPFALAVHG